MRATLHIELWVNSQRTTCQRLEFVSATLGDDFTPQRNGPLGDS